MSTRPLLAALALVLALPFAGRTTVYDAASSFSSTANPNGVWSYGFSTTLGSPMMLDLERTSDNGIDVWRTNIWLGAPSVFHNGTSQTLTNNTGTLVVPAGALGLHPGPGGQYSLLRFTAPAEGAYQVAAAFSGLDIFGTTTDVHLLTNGTSLFDGQVSGYGPGPSFSTTVALKAGGTIDFAVGWGANHEFSWDGTGLAAQITSQTTPPAGCQPPPAGQVGWWRAEGNALDSAGTNNGALGGGASYGPGRVGQQAFAFDGTNSYVAIPSASSLDVGAGPGLTIEGWLEPQGDIGNNWACLAEWNDGAGSLGAHFWLSQPEYYPYLGGGPGCLFVNLVDTGFNFHLLSTPAHTMGTNGWQHVAVTYDKASGMATIYRNGAVVASANMGTFQPETRYGFNFGKRLSFGDTVGPYRGEMDEMSLYSRALSAAEIQAIYAAEGAGKCVANTPGVPAITTQPASQAVNVGANVSFNVVASSTSPLSYQWRFNGDKLAGQTSSVLSLANVQLANAGTYSVVVSNLAGAVTSANALLTVNALPDCTQPPAGLVDWWRAEGNALDSAGTHNGTLSGGTSFAVGEVGQGFSFNGYNAAVDLGNWFNLQNFSVAMWVKPGTSQSTYADIIDNNHSNQPYRSWVVQYQNTGLRFAWALFSVNSGFVAIPFDLKAETWQYLVLTLDADRTARVYLDGQLQGSTNLIGAVSYDGTQFLRLGRWGAGGRYFNGALDEVDVYSRALAPTEIQALYASGSAGKCFNLFAPTITTQPVSQVTTVGLNAAFTVAASGSPPLRYQWFFNGAKLSGKTGSLLNLPNVQLTNAGSYSVVVSNLAGTATSSNALLTVNVPGCVAPAAGLVSWWRAESNTVDSVSANNGTRVGSVSYWTGMAGRGFVFSGNGSYVQLANTTNLQVQDFSIECWVKRNSVVVATSSGADGGNLFGYGTAGYNFGLFNDGRLVLSKVGISDVRTTALVTDTSFHHLAVTKSGSNVVFYVDGVAYPAPAYDPGFTFSGAPVIGALGSLGHSFWGTIDELSFYNRGLSAAEVQSIYLASVAGKCAVPPFILTQPVSQSVIEGSSATLSVTADGSPQLHYQWLFNGTNIPGATGASLTLNQAQWTNSGVYSVLVANAFGTALSSNAVLAVDRIPVATGGNVVVAAGSDCTAAASVDQGSFDPDGDPLSLSQTPPGPYPLGTNLVTLTVMDNRGASNTCTALVIVLNQTPPTLICPADIVVTNAHNAWTSVVTYAPSAVDNCSGVSQPVCDPPSGTVFGLGTHTISISAADAAGNVAHGSFKVTVLSGNVPPVPVIQIQPLAQFPGETNLMVIAPDNQQATVVLDGSQSYDADDASFLSLWYGGTNLLGTNLVSTCVLDLGTNDITLWLDDTFPLGTNSASVAVEVITPAQAATIIAGMLQDLKGAHTQALLASLNAAEAAFQRGDFNAGVNELRAFQSKVHVQVAPKDPALADALIQSAQQIINALTSVVSSGHGPVKTLSLTHQQGKMHLKFAGPAGKVHLVQASTNMVDWQTIGTATDRGDGSFEFEDAKAGGLPARFYRIVAP